MRESNHHVEEMIPSSPEIPLKPSTRRSMRMIASQTLPFLKNRNTITERPMLEFVDWSQISAQQQMVLTHSTRCAGTVLEAVTQAMLRNRRTLEKLARKFQRQQRADLAEGCNQNISKIDSMLAELDRMAHSRYHHIEPSEEGLYIEEQLPLHGMSQSLIEQRLLRQHDGLEKYFDETGRAFQIHNMRKRKFTKPDTYDLFTFDEPESNMLKRTRPAIQGFTSGGTDGKIYQLDVDIQKIQFEDHPLMSEEDYNCAILENYMTRYQYSRDWKRISYNLNKIKAIRVTLAQMRNDMAKNTNHQSRDDDIKNEIYDENNMTRKREMSTLRAEIKELTKEMEDLEKERHTMLDTIVDQWNKVRAIRKNTGFTACNHRMVFVEEDEGGDGDDDDDSARDEEELERTSVRVHRVLEEDVLEELKELKEEREWQYELQMHQYKKKMESLKESLASQTSDHDPMTVEMLHRPVLEPTREVFHERMELYRIRARKRKARRPVKEIVYTPILQRDCMVTRDVELLVQEKERRRKIFKSEYYVQLLVNDHIVSKTAARHLQLDFDLIFGEVISVGVREWPKSITCKVFRKELMRDVEVAKVYLPVSSLGANHSRGTVEQQYESPLQQQQQQHPESDRIAQFTGVITHEHAWKRDWEPSVLEKLRSFISRTADMDALHHTTGRVIYDMKWVSANGCGPPEMPHSEREARNLLERISHVNTPAAKDLLSMQKMKKWMSTNKIDPNDPQNTGLLSMLEMVENENITSSGFHLTVQDDSLLLENASASYRRRLYLLRRRYEHMNKLRFKVPLLDEMVSLKMVRNFEKQIETDCKSESLGEYVKNIRALLDENEEGDFETNWNKKKKKKKEQKKTDERRLTVVKKVVDVSKYVREIPQPQMSGIQWIKDFFSPYRPLNPTRIERNVDPVSNVTKCKVIVQVIRGYHIPVRKQDTENDSYRNFRATVLREAEIGGIHKQFAREPGVNQGTMGHISQLQEVGDVVDASSTQDGSSGLFKTQIDSHNPSKIDIDAQRQANEEMRQRMSERVLSFVSVTFQGQNKRTRSIEGPYPQFNETIELDFRPPNDDFSPDSVKFVDQQIYLDLFDEITVDTLKNDTDLHLLNQRNESRWLGSVSVPFSTLYENQKIVGSFTIKTPPVYLAYETPDESNLPSLTMVMTLDPILSQPDHVESIVSSGESPQDFHRANSWVSFVKKRVPGRHILALAPNNSGKATLIMRFIRDQEPPAKLDSVSQCLRFVSLIPSVNDTLAFDHGDVWVDSQTFLDTLAGDSEEHAILLCNYLKHLKKRVWIVLGKGVPEGDSAYVLTLEKDGYKLWNAETGQTFRLHDHQSSCPLREVHLIFDDTNIWANIQKEVHPFKINLQNFEDSAHEWLPFYTQESSITATIKKIFNRKRTEKDGLNQHQRLQSVQQTRLVYENIPLEITERLMMDIENKIKMSFIEWRRKHTQFHSHVGSQLSKVLREFEVAKQNGEVFKDEKHNQMLQDIRESFTLIGFPLNFTFTDMKSILEEVHNTMIHDLQEERIEFALGVYVHPYVNNVFSVWIYLTGLLERF